MRSTSTFLEWYQQYCGYNFGVLMVQYCKTLLNPVCAMQYATQLAQYGYYRIKYRFGQLPILLEYL